MAAEVATNQQNAVTDEKVASGVNETKPQDDSAAKTDGKNDAVNTADGQTGNDEGANADAKGENHENANNTTATKTEAPPKYSVHKTNFEKDVIYLYQFSRTPLLPSLSPYCLKVETWLRLAGLKYEVSTQNYFSSNFIIFSKFSINHSFCKIDYLKLIIYYINLRTSIFFQCSFLILKISLPGGHFFISFIHTQILMIFIYNFYIGTLPLFFSYLIYILLFFEDNFFCYIAFEDTYIQFKYESFLKSHDRTVLYTCKLFFLEVFINFMRDFIFFSLS